MALKILNDFECRIININYLAKSHDICHFKLVCVVYSIILYVPVKPAKVLERAEWSKFVTYNDYKLMGVQLKCLCSI